MIYKRGKTYWYNFRWTIKNADGTNESFRIVKSAKAQSRADAKEVERGLKSDVRIGPGAYLSPGAAFAGGGIWCRRTLPASALSTTPGGGSLLRSSG